MKKMCKIPTKQDYEYAREIMNAFMERGGRALLDDDKKYDHCYTTHRTLFEKWLMKEYQFFISSGASKMCFVPAKAANFDWVIKIDFMRKSRAGSRFADGYVRKEAEYFKEACERGIEEYFAATYYVDTIQDATFVLQEYCHEADIWSEFDSYVRSYMSRSFDEDEEDYNDRVSGEISYLGDTDRIYAALGTSDKVDDLIEFVNTRGINDLHEENWGMNSECNIVMIDYSGFGC